MKKLALFLMLSCFLFSAEWYKKATINGYFSHEFERLISGDKEKLSNVKQGGSPDQIGSFDADSFDLVFNFQATDRVRMAMDIGFEHGTYSEIDKGGVVVEYAFAEYAVSDLFKIRAGKMFVPFGIYNEIHTAKPSFVVMKEPTPTNKMYFIENDKYELIGFFPRWGAGVAFLGNGDIADKPFDYIFMIDNGEREYAENGEKGNEFDKDDNNQKAITARVRANLTDDLLVGASFRSDRIGIYQEGSLKNGEVDKSRTDKQYYATHGDILSYGLQANWNITDTVALEAEYIYGTYSIAGAKHAKKGGGFDETEGKTIRRYGYSVMPTWLVDGDKTTLYFMYAEADPNMEKSQNKVRIYQPGVNIELDTQFHLKFELYNVQTESKNTKWKGVDYTEFRSSLSFGF